MSDPVQNLSPCVVHPFRSVDRHGYEVLVVIAKLTYAVSARGAVRLPTEPEPVRITAELSGAGRWASHRFPSDCIDEKPGTDVLLVGTAHPPGRVRQMDVGLRVVARDGKLGKLARVSGPRVWMRGMGGIRPSDPGWLEPTPLIYEESYGGHDESDPDAPLVDLRNPAGRGVARDRKTLVDQAAPSIEDPAAPLDSGDPAPAGFGPLPSSWAPRRDFAGTFDEAWHRWRAPIPPEDFDPRHNSVSPPGLWTEQPLIGNEPVDVIGVRPEGAWHFQLPRFRPTFAHASAGQSRPLPSHLDTYLIDADRGRVELTWRIALRMARNERNLGTIVVDSEGDGAFDAVFGDSLMDLVRAT